MGQEGLSNDFENLFNDEAGWLIDFEFQEDAGGFELIRQVIIESAAVRVGRKIWQEEENKIDIGRKWLEPLAGLYLVLLDYENPVLRREEYPRKDFRQLYEKCVDNLMTPTCLETIIRRRLRSEEEVVNMQILLNNEIEIRRNKRE